MSLESVEESQDAESPETVQAKTGFAVLLKGVRICLRS